MAFKEGEWLKQHGFNENRMTYIYFPSDSYEVKDQLKEAGFRFEKILLWHAPEIPAGYEDKVVEVWFDAIGVMSAWHEGFLGGTAETIIKERIRKARPHVESKSQWVGKIGDKINGEFKITFMKGVNTKYGLTNLVKFEDKEGNNYTWWSTAKWVDDIDVGDLVPITGVIKDHSEYEGIKSTVVTRCRRG